MSEFHFLRPWWFLALVPALLVLWRLWRARRKASPWSAVCDPVLLQCLWLQAPADGSRLPLVLLAFGWLLAVIALAGPVWERQPQPVYLAQPARVVVLDLSASMQATDVSPSRLARARFKIEDILARSQEGRTALVVFAGEPHLVTPLTEDGATISNLLQALSVDLMPTQGDAGAPALRLAAELLEREGVEAGQVLLISDGLADPATALAQAQGLRASGHRLSVLTVGTAQGAPLPGPSGGFTGMARVDSGPLRALARAGGGGFSPLSADDSDLGRVLMSQGRVGQAVQVEDAGVERWVERGAWLLPVVLLLAAAGFRRGWLGPAQNSPVYARFRGARPARREQGV